MYERYYFREGNMEKALFYGGQIIDISEKNTCRYIYFGVAPLLEMNARILSQLSQRDLLQRQLRAMDNWRGTLPALLSIRADYSAKLQQHSPDHVSRNTSLE